MQPPSQELVSLDRMDQEAKKPPLPLMYRVMFADDKNQPIVADDAGLGVREGIDVSVGPNAVVPAGQGMSVFDAPNRIPASRRPKDHGGLGDDGTFCFVWGEGPFQNALLNDDLKLVLGLKKKKHHGQIEPTKDMTLTVYRQCLVATKPSWVLVRGSYAAP